MEWFFREKIRHSASYAKLFKDPKCIIFFEGLLGYADSNTNNINPNDSKPNDINPNDINPNNINPKDTYVPECDTNMNDVNLNVTLTRMT